MVRQKSKSIFMIRKIAGIAIILLVSALGLNAQSYVQSSGNVCAAWSNKQYTFTGTPETPVDAAMSVTWLYCGPYINSNYGNIYMDIWIDGSWQDLWNGSDSGSGCSWVTNSFTISAGLLNDAINSNGGTVLIQAYISDPCPGGYGCSCCADPCFNATLSYDYAPSADFSVSSTETCVGGFVSFYNESLGPQETFEWNFGVDADPATVTGVGPHNVQWLSSGMKEVTLTVNGNGEESVEVKTDFINVGTAPSSIIIGDAYENWQHSSYAESVVTKRIMRNNADGYYIIGEYEASSSHIWVQKIDETGNEIWYSVLSGGNTDQFQDAVVDGTGNLFLTGQRSNDILVSKVNTDGSTAWNTQYNFSGEDEGTAIDLDPDGNIYIAGSKNDLYEAFAVKFDSDGNFVYGVEVTGGGSNLGTDILIDDGYFYLLSWGRTDGINADMHLSKYEQILGIHQWTEEYNGNGFSTDEAHEMETYGDYVYMMGRSDQGADNGWTVVQISKDGNEGWSQDYFMGEAGWDASDRFGMDSEGNLYLASTLDSDADQAVRLYKIDKTNGSEIWQHQFDGINDTWLEAITIGDNDVVYALTKTMNNSGDWDLATFEISQVPEVDWWAVYDGCGSDDDSPGGLVSTPNHEVISAGFNTQAVAIRYGALVEPDAQFQVSSGPACLGSPVVFEDMSEGSGLAYNWNFGPSADPADATGPGPHEVVYDSSGLKTTSLFIENSLGTSEIELEIEVYAVAEISVSEAMDLCIGESVLLAASGAGTIEWSDGLGTEPSVEVNPTETTEYTATLTDSNGCTDSETILVTVFDYPEVNAGDDITACEGAEVMLMGSGEGELSWDNGAGDGATPTITVDESLTYTITSINEAGCESSDTMTLTAEESPDITVSGDVSLCNGESTELIASGADSYIWSPGEIEGSSLIVAPDETTVYSVSGSGSNGCESVVEIEVNVSADPDAFAGEDQTVCSGEEASLSASGGTSYEWEDLGAGSDQVVIPTETTTYTVIVTNEFGCQASDDVIVTVNESPEAFAGEDSQLCIGDEITLTGTGGVTYEWVGEGTGQSITVTPEGTTTYTLIATASNGCSDEDEVVVTVLPLPNVNAGPDAEICLGESTVLNAVGGDIYEWDNALGEGQSHEVSPLLSTTYSVLVTDANGCQNSDEVEVVVNSLPAANAGADQAICPGETTTLTASGGVDYEWDNGAGTNASVDVSPSETTIYTVTAIDENGCEGTDEVVVEVHPEIEVTIDGLTTDPYCVESDVAIAMTGNPLGGTFSGPGVAGNEFVPTNAGIGTHDIIYEYEDSNECTFSSTFVVSVEVCSGIEQSGGLEMVLYPNPAGEIVTLEISGGHITNGTISIIDNLGKRIYMTPILGAKTEMDLSRYAGGNYTVRIYDNRVLVGEKRLVVE
jgi:hypothetical protein